MKTQSVRLIDIFYLGPSMAYAGMLPSRLPGWLRLTLVIGGVLTVIYNGRNYLLNKGI
jgi:hypothetical protein